MRSLTTRVRRLELQEAPASEVAEAIRVFRERG